MSQHTATIDGKVYTRNSKRTYTHVMVARTASGNACVWSWHGTAKAAQARAKTEGGHWASALGTPEALTFEVRPVD